MTQRVSPSIVVNFFTSCVAFTLVASQAAFADPEPGPMASGSGVEVETEATVRLPETAKDEFGPVDAPFPSLANIVPPIYSWFNDNRIFGLPGTRTGGIGERTHLTNDWGGRRTEWARKGVFISLDNTTAYQNVSGGLNSGSAVISNTQLSLDLDTGRLGWWGGGLLHFSLEARNGSDNADVYGAGTMVPTYYGAVLPQPERDNDLLFTNLFLEQAFGEYGLIIGVIPGLYVPDRTLFGDDWKRFFGNYAFNENPIFTQFFNPQTTTITGSWSPDKQVALSLGVYDANTDTTDIGNDFFSEINIYGQGTYSYQVSDLPGQALLGSLWSNQKKLNLREPFTDVDLTAVFGLGGSANVPNPILNFKDSSWFVIANFSQYLHVETAPENRAKVMERGEALRGIGLIGRFGYSPEDTTAITQHYSLAAFAHGMLDTRPDDTFGAGGYYNRLSGDMKDGLSAFSGGDLSIKDESGIEMFYDFAITPAFSINLSYQHVWNPFQSALAGGEDSADIVMVRYSARF